MFCKFIWPSVLPGLLRLVINNDCRRHGGKGASAWADVVSFSWEKTIQVGLLRVSSKVIHLIVKNNTTLGHDL